MTYDIKSRGPYLTHLICSYVWLVFPNQVVDWVALGEVELMSISSTLGEMMHPVMMIVPWAGEYCQARPVIWHKIVCCCVQQ